MRPRRNVTVSPIQALNLFNSKMTLEWAQYFAGRVLEKAGNNEEKQIDLAYRLAFGHDVMSGAAQSVIAAGRAVREAF